MQPSMAHYSYFSYMTMAIIVVRSSASSTRLDDLSENYMIGRQVMGWLKYQALVTPNFEVFNEYTYLNMQQCWIPFMVMDKFF